MVFYARTAGICVCLAVCAPLREGADRFSYQGHNLILDIMNSEDKLTPADAKVLGIPYPPYQAKDFFSDPKVAELAQAARQGDVKHVDALIAKGVKVNARGAEGLTPLMYALSGKTLKGFERLLERGADPNLQTEFGESTVSYAAARNGSEALKMVLAHRGNPNLRGRLGPPYTNPFTEPPIYDAITFRRPENARILIKAGADLNARNWLGSTPLMDAAVIYSYDVAYVLLEAGADFRATDPLGYTFIHYLVAPPKRDPKSALVKWRQKCIEFLEKKGVDFAKEKLKLAEFERRRIEEQEREQQKLRQREKEKAEAQKTERVRATKSSEDAKSR